MAVSDGIHFHARTRPLRGSASIRLATDLYSQLGVHGPEHLETAAQELLQPSDLPVFSVDGAS